MMINRRESEVPIDIGIRRANSRAVSLRPLRVFLCTLCGKIFLLLALTIIITSCSRKRAPSKGCDCPGGHGMLKEKSISEPTAFLYHKSGSRPS